MRPDRIRQAMTAKGMTQAELGRLVGVSQGAIQQILAGDTARSRYLPAIARELDVSVHWLDGESDDPDMPVVSLATVEDLTERFNVARLREVDIGYAMGAGTFIDDHPDIVWATFDSRWLRRLTNSNPEQLFVAQGVGDSMMTTMLDSDTIIVDRGRPKIDQQDRIWAVAYGELGMIKRIRRLPSGRYLMISDNPAVADFEADASEFHVVGRVIWIGRAA